MKSTYPQELKDLYVSDINLLHSMIMSSRVQFASNTYEAPSAPEVVSFVELQNNHTSEQHSYALEKRSTRNKQENVDFYSGNFSAMWTQNNSSFWNLGNGSTGEILHDDRKNSIEVVLAHKFHYCSVSILAILVVEVIILICYIILSPVIILAL